ncbi:MAG: lipocalin family protein [Methylibium sp.]|uniref:lipocalin family protein n=1 Tax=Methylibium sp. TaxID=2067992 RepID=UPI00180E655A|nr:lipocalin family protein [Methylibium sp.]MBA3596653.1 lipocalin family protein [Methylibium sp.]
MNAASADAGVLDLDEQIDAAELAVIDRDRRVRDRTQGAVRRVKAHAGRSVAIGVGAVAGLFLLFRGAKRGSRPGLARAGLGAAALAGATRRRPIMFTRLMTMAWPLLPVSLRQRISPQMLSLVSIGLPLLAGLKATASAPDPSTATNLDLPRYTGRWFEIARMPLRSEAKCESDVSATYLLNNDGIAVINQCLREDGSAAVVQGEARMTDPDDPAKLEVSFAPEWMRFLPFVWADYWILHVDADYESALVGTPDRKHLWLLSRAPFLAGERYQRLVDHARLKGYDSDRLTLTRQQG